MRRSRTMLVVAAILVATGLGFLFARDHGGWFGGRTYRGDGKVEITTPKFEGNDYRVQAREAQIPTTGDPVEHTLRLLLSTVNDKNGGDPAIPKGTRLLSVKVTNGDARVNLSSEFNELTEHGETTEGLAQQQFCRALAQFPEITTMTVVVDDKPFESQHADWEKVPIRVDNANGGMRQ